MRNKYEIEICSTSPQSKDVTREAYVRHLIDIAQWSEEAGCKAILVYTDNSLVDPWLVSQIILVNTQKLCPLVAVQPIYMHPYTVAKMVASFGHLYGRRVYLNMVAGGFKNDMLAFNDATPHDKRYARLVEYTTIIKLLLSGPKPVTFEGEFYRLKNVQMMPPLDSELFPGLFISGSSEAGLQAAVATGATAIQYPKPAQQCEPVFNNLRAGLRIGIVARENNADAWRVACERFPEDRRGQIAHKLAMEISDSQWHKQISDLAKETSSTQTVFWLGPFENYKTFCPYLVGNYKEVSEEISKYVEIGYRTFILDTPANREELQHIQLVFKMASEEAVQ